MEKVLRKSLLCFVLVLLASFSFGQGSTIMGTVLYNNTFPMDDVNADLLDGSGTVIASTTTNGAGLYEFTNIPNGNYSIVFSTNEPAGGVTLTDAFLVMLHLFNLYPFTEFQEMVADVNGSGSVTWSDYFEILVSYLNQGNPFSGGDWVFESIDVSVSGGNRDGFVSSGGSNGDVNGTFQPPKYGNCFVNNNVPSQSIRPNEAKDLQLGTEQALEVSGMHLIFNVPEGLAVNSVSSYLTDVHFNQEANEIRVTWISEDLSSIQIIPTEPFLVFNVSASPGAAAGITLDIELDSESHFIGKAGEMLPFVNLVLPGLTVESEADIHVIETIYPNPFLSTVTLEYMLPAEGNVKIAVTNNTGQLVQVVSNEFQTSGVHRIQIDGANWPTGIYHYSIYFAGSKALVKSGSMIKSK